ncbi:MAG TPA: CBS domain-containing protein [Gemmataceae bacterium]|nr:CBS domain-containing protein [Gemmataceae bacterium]
MNDHATADRPGTLVLHAATAADVMMPNPVSLRADATVAEAIALLTDRGFNAAPVIDEAGHPIGVLSHTDLLAHERERSPGTGGSGEPDPTRVYDLMTPAVFSVSPDTSAAQVVDEMLAHRVHRLFVVDSTGVLVGVVAALDVLRRLRPSEL